MCNIEVNLYRLLLLLLCDRFLALPFECVVYWCLLLLVAFHIWSKLVFVSAHHVVLFKIRQEAIVLSGECALHYLLYCTWIRNSLHLLSYRSTLSKLLAWFPCRCDFLNRLDEIHWRIYLYRFSCRSYHPFVFLLHYIIRLLKHRPLHVI